MDKHHIYIKMAIEGVTSPAFSAVTLPPFSTRTDSRELIVKKSRTKYSRDRESIENEIVDWNKTESEPPALLMRKYEEKAKPAEPKPEIKQFENVGGKDYRRFKDSAEKGWYIEAAPKTEGDTTSSSESVTNE